MTAARLGAILCRGFAGLLALGLASGCGRPPKGQEARRAGKEAQRPAMHVELNKGELQVDDRQGRPQLRATADRTVGDLMTNSADKGPITLVNVRSRIFKEGKEDIHLTSPTALWQDRKMTADRSAHVETVDGTMKADAQRAVWEDGVLRMYQVTATLFKDRQPQVRLSAPEAYARDNLLIAEKTAHAESPDGRMKLDAQKAVYTRATAHLLLERATGQQLENGKPTFVGEAPRADYQNDLITLTQGGQGRRLDNGSTVRADRVQWHRVTGKLEANGNVRLESPDMRAEAAQLVGSTTLKKGRLTGRPRPRVFIKRRPA